MHRKKHIHRHEDVLEKEQKSRSKAQSVEKGNQQLDALTIQQVRLDPSKLKPEDVHQLQSALGNQEVKRQLKGIQASPGPDGPTEKKKEQTGGQRAVTVTPEEKETLSGKICFDAVAYCLSLAGLITEPQYGNGITSTGAALDKLVNQDDTKAVLPNIPAEEVVGIFRRSNEGGELQLSHVMISLGGGLAIGSNNGCIGGSGDWSVQDLSTLLTWDGKGNPTYDKDESVAVEDGTTSNKEKSKAPLWFRERVVCHRSVGVVRAKF